MNNRINFDWFYRPDYYPSYNKELMINPKKIDLPHTNVEIPFNYVDEKTYQIESTYQKQIFIDDTNKGKVILLRFEAVGHYAEVFINGNLVGSHKGGYTPFEFNIASFIKYNDLNLITVYVNSKEDINIPPFGNVIDYLTYGGIYREVSLSFKNPTYIEDVNIYGENLLTKPNYKFTLMLSDIFEGEVLVDVFHLNKKLHQQRYKIKGQELNQEINFDKFKLWDIDDVNLYKFVFKLIKNEQVIDLSNHKTGFREAIFKLDGFYLNGRKLKLNGLNRHQCYPYVGYAMPKRAQEADAKILKDDLGVNIVRTSHYPQSPHFLNACDELGLLVFEEIPGWQFIGNNDWKEVALYNVQEMIQRDRHHPSIILWGVRINESGDDYDFYTKTNQLARNLDKNRQTGGVRCFAFSEVLEDVYTMNDFIYEGYNEPLRKVREITDQKIPYLVTEHTGHMFPTKSFDTELKRLEHAKMHLKIINQMMEDSEITGVIGWCMHDYNTHKDFGSGDRICYHGVLDMFRNTKMAADVYTSQNSNQPHLTVSTNFNIGEYSKGYIDEALIFTNCDYIKVYRNDEFVANLYPNKKDYPGLKHPPINMDWLGELLITKEDLNLEQSNRIKHLYRGLLRYGEKNLPDVYNGYTDQEIKLAWHLYGKYVANWGTRSIQYTFIGFVNEKEVLQIKKGNDYKKIIKVYADDYELKIAETYDVTRVTVEAINELDDRLVFSNDAFVVETDEKLEIIGEATISLIGGIRSFWVRTKDLTGLSTVKINHQGNNYLVNINILREDI